MAIVSIANSDLKLVIRHKTLLLLTYLKNKVKKFVKYPALKRN